jgi:hypothetical protein
MLGNSMTIFVIMGLSSELADKLSGDIYAQQISNLLPTNCQIIPYDTLFHSFHAAVPPRIFVVVPRIDVFESSSVDVLLGDVEPLLYWWDIFLVTEQAIETWRRVESRVRRIAGTGGILIDRKNYLLSDGSLATETDNPQHFCDAILTVLRRLRHLGEEHGADSQQLSRFLAASKLLTGRWRRAEVSPEEGPLFRAMRAAARDCERSHKSTTWIDVTEAQVARLEQMGLVKFSTIESAERWHHVHPITRCTML